MTVKKNRKLPKDRKKRKTKVPSKKKRPKTIRKGGGMFGLPDRNRRKPMSKADTKKGAKKLVLALKFYRALKNMK